MKFQPGNKIKIKNSGDIYPDYRGRKGVVEKVRKNSVDIKLFSTKSKGYRGITFSMEFLNNYIEII